VLLLICTTFKFNSVVKKNTYFAIYIIKLFFLYLYLYYIFKYKKNVYS